MKRPEPMRFAQSNGTFLCYRVRDDALGFAGDGGVKLKRPAQSDSLRKLDQKEYAPHSHVRQAYHHCCGVPGTGHISGEREGVCSAFARWPQAHQHHCWFRARATYRERVNVRSAR